MKLRALLIILFVFCSLDVYAGIVLKAEADQTSVTADEVVTYKLTITASGRKVPVPVLPSFEDFAVLSSAQSTTTTFQKGELKIFVVHAFVLLPRKTGILTIPPATFTAGKDVYSSESIKIEVKESTGVPVPPGSRSEHPSPSQPDTQPPEPDEPEYIL